jgi:hypothetical protein
MSRRPAQADAGRRLSSHERANARRLLRDFSLRECSEADLIAEYGKRRCDIALYQAELATTKDPGVAERLRGGIAFEIEHIERLATELERRERAAAFGYIWNRDGRESGFAARFAQAKRVGLVDVIRTETGQTGMRAGTNWKFSCPFHSGGQERSPSLVAYPDGHFHCFGCGAHGADGVAFLAELRCLGQVEALRLLESGVLGVGITT